MQQSCTYGSVRGASGNRRPYRDKRVLDPQKQPSLERRINSLPGLVSAEKGFFSNLLV